MTYLCGNLPWIDTDADRLRATRQSAVFLQDASGRALMPIAPALARTLVQGRKAHWRHHYVLPILRLRRTTRDEVIMRCVCYLVPHPAVLELFVVVEGAMGVYPILAWSVALPAPALVQYTEVWYRAYSAAFHGTMRTLKKILPLTHFSVIHPTQRLQGRITYWLPETTAHRELWYQLLCGMTIYHVQSYWEDSGEGWGPHPPSAVLEAGMQRLMTRPSRYVVPAIVYERHWPWPIPAAASPMVMPSASASPSHPSRTIPHRTWCQWQLPGQKARSTGLSDGWLPDGRVRLLLPSCPDPTQVCWRPWSIDPALVQSRATPSLMIMPVSDPPGADQLDPASWQEDDYAGT